MPFAQAGRACGPVTTLAAPRVPDALGGGGRTPAARGRGPRQVRPRGQGHCLLPRRTLHSTRPPKPGKWASWCSGPRLRPRAGLELGPRRGRATVIPGGRLQGARVPTRLYLQTARGAACPPGTADVPSCRGGSVRPGRPATSGSPQHTSPWMRGPARAARRPHCISFFPPWIHCFSRYS